MNSFIIKKTINLLNFTCYTHLQCNRGPSPTCLDWSEICNGQIDYVDSEIDEEHCWQLELNECNDDEYRCTNGQCIQRSFVRDDTRTSECTDGSDEVRINVEQQNKFKTLSPSFEVKDSTCSFSFLTYSCIETRKDLLLEAIYSIKDSSISEECWVACRRVMNAYFQDKILWLMICHNNPHIEIINKICPDMFYIPHVPFLFGHIYLVHTRDDSKIFANEYFQPLYLCYTNSRYDEFFFHQPKIFFDNKTCFRSKVAMTIMITAITWQLNYYPLVFGFYKQLKGYNSVINYAPEMCNRSNMYQCMNSRKCIPVNRLMDTVNDCPQRDDANMAFINTAALTKQLKSYFKCEISNKYIHQSSAADRKCNCEVHPFKWCEDESLDITYARKNISFLTICDGFTELFPIMIEERNETDETECELWSYEVGCNLSPMLNCSTNDHICVSPDTNQLICLPITKANDGKIACLGSIDETTLCHIKYEVSVHSKLYFGNTTPSLCIGSGSLYNGYSSCKHGDDEQFCRTTNQTGDTGRVGICAKSQIKQDIKYFSLDPIKKSTEDQINHATDLSLPAIETSHE
ncbi:unnamed protein product [Rotaria magnacalcarata]|uniref:Uncharacterized protein n=1 Tax=Rotaria magnacalcarata TaxID=392030 RepID=A0A8S3BSW6_9BILA|nr:unnamed protein product [Rotaria magnacalcarata]